MFAAIAGFLLDLDAACVLVAAPESAGCRSSHDFESGIESNSQAADHCLLYFAIVPMAHISSDPDKKLLARVRRIRGQIGIERAIEESTDCYAVLQQTAAVRGALNGLMAELIEGHIRHHVLGDSKNRTGAEELIEIVRSFLR